MTVQAELEDGRIVELPKDCGCLPELHEGPCFLDWNDMEQWLNLNALAKNPSYPVLFHWFCGREKDRLHERGAWMTQNKIKRLIYEKRHVHHLEIRYGEGLIVVWDKIEDKPLAVYESKLK